MFCLPGMFHKTGRQIFVETIQEPVSNVLKILGEPKAAPDGWRWTNHLVFQEVGEGTLAFNTLTRELALLSPEEFGSPDECLELRERWFRVPASIDDKSSADLVRLVLESLHQRPEHVTTYHVFTTMDCNARCFYCYEKDRVRPTMSVGTAHKTADYIVRHCGGNKVRLAWFGGEPLYNAQVIDLICNDLVERGIGYESSMISNGFLFDEKLIKRAAELWRLRQIQITLDGTEGVYNAVKRYVDAGEKSPYQVVLANIRGLLDAGVRVIVRLNVSRANAKNLLALVDDLEARFAGARLLSVYCGMTSEFDGIDIVPMREDATKELFWSIKNLDLRLERAGLLERRGIKAKIPMAQCMADSGGSLTVLPDGHLGLCEHYSEDNFVGSIDSDELDESVVQSFRERGETMPRCATCFEYPTCIRLRKCPFSAKCLPETVALAKTTLQDEMVSMYNAKKK